MTLGVGGFHFQQSMGNAAAGVDASGARSAARRAESEVGLMKSEMERLLMITEALWLMLKEQHGYTDDDLIKRIAEIDLRDGRLDGRVAPDEAEVPKCPKCQRPIGKKRPTCLYCGAALVRQPFER